MPSIINATFCTGVNYTGTCTTVGPATMDYLQMLFAGIADEAVQSIRVSPYTYVWAYANSGFAGATWTIVNSVPDLSVRGASKSISSFVVGPSPAVAFNVGYLGGALCLDLPANSNLDGTQLVVATCNNSAEQAFRFAQSSPGVFNLVTKSAQKCIDVAGDSILDGAMLEQRSCTAKYNTVSMGFANAQRTGTFNLKISSTGKCMDVVGGASVAGTAVDQYFCNSTSAQIWNLSVATTTTAPTTDVTKTFRVMPMFNGMANQGNITTPQLRAEMQNLTSQIGQNQNYFRVGFTHVFSDPDSLARNVTLANDSNLSIGVIIPVQTHDVPSDVAQAAAYDFRSYQWRLDGQSWQGLQVLTGGNQTLDSRDYLVVTPSRYCIGIKKQFQRAMSTAAGAVKRLLTAYPTTVAFVSIAVEEELAIGGSLADAYLADYSPFAIAEFKDWLRHTGIYDDLSGSHAGEAAPASIVGSATIAGATRSPFYDDPTPGDSNGTGSSFNATFGTSFTTWTLAYWDPNAFPNIINDPNFDPSPTSGNGATAGGFDAPRVHDANNAYWNAWSWDLGDHNNTWPVGDPTAPAFGFRQFMVQHFLNDQLDTLTGMGIPTNLIYTHQLAAEFAGTARGLSSAAPMWAGALKNGNLGNTRFGNYDPVRAAKYSKNWGIFEWHPQPYASASDPNLYNLTIADLDSYYIHYGNVFVPYVWNSTSSAYVLNGSNFAQALHDWLATRPDQSR